MQRVQSTRLRTQHAWIDVRWTAINGRWIASADTPDGPTLGVGSTPHEALSAALEPFGTPSGQELDAGTPDAGHDPRP
jgi:hypothetical protein